MKLHVRCHTLPYCRAGATNNAYTPLLNKISKNRIVYIYMYMAPNIYIARFYQSHTPTDDVTRL